MNVKSILPWIIVILSLVFFWTTGNSQITLEQTYNGYTYVANLSNSGYKYYVLDTQNETLKLYHPDHTLWKTVNLSVPNGYQLLTTVYNVSENLFSLDDKVGFTYSYYTTTPNYQAETRVINENGTVLLTIPGATYAYASNVEDEAKLLAYITNNTTNVTTTKVYDLPGNLVTGDNQIYDASRLPFPNPAQKVIVIPYNSDEMKSGGTVEIFDLSGNCIRQYAIDVNFDNLTLDTSTFPCGTYIFTIKNSIEETGSGKFVIQ